MTAHTDRPDVIETLTDDHRDMLGLIADIRVQDSSDKRNLADTLIAEIVRHSVAEEMHVYPAMRRNLPDGDEQVQHDISEHQELEETLKALEGVDADDDRFTAVLDKLEEQLRHHAKDEESEQFPLLREHLSEDELRDLGAKVVTAKEIAPTRPHPASPHAALFHMLVGPGVGFVDKLRDSLSGRSRNT